MAASATSVGKSRRKASHETNLPPAPRFLAVFVAMRESSANSHLADRLLSIVKLIASKSLRPPTLQSVPDPQCERVRQDRSRTTRLGRKGSCVQNSKMADEVVRSLDACCPPI